MTQQQSAAVLQIDRRGPERQTLFLAQNSLKAAEADLDASHRAVSDDWNAKMSAENELTTLRTVAPDMGAVPLLSKIEQAVIAGVEPSLRYFNDEEEKFAARLKSALQDVEFYTRRRAAREASISRGRARCRIGASQGEGGRARRHSREQRGCAGHE